MKKTLTTQEAIDMVFQTGSFSLAGALALVQYLEQIEEGTGEDMEIDPVGLACEFTEYDSLREAAEDFIEAPEWEASTNDDENNSRIREFFQGKTTLIEFDGGVIVQGF
jgi:hypothetical protein